MPSGDMWENKPQVHQHQLVKQTVRMQRPQLTPMILEMIYREIGRRDKGMNQDQH